MKNMSQKTMAFKIVEENYALVNNCYQKVVTVYIDGQRIAARIFSINYFDFKKGPQRTIIDGNTYYQFLTAVGTEILEDAKTSANPQEHVKYRVFNGTNNIFSQHFGVAGHNDTTNNFIENYLNFDKYY